MSRAASSGMLNPTVVADDRVIGLWKRTLKRDRVEVALQPFQAWTDGQWVAVEAAAEEYGRFLELDLVLR